MTTDETAGEVPLDRRGDASPRRRVSSSPPLRVAIFGGSGYGGAELLRILLAHPHVEIALVTANSEAGKRISDVHRNLRGFTDLSFTVAPQDLGQLKDFDCVFLALPHGQAMEIVPQLPQDLKVIDLSGDFRLPGKEYEKYYGLKHTAVEAQGEFVYGLTEMNREEIKKARLVSNPGCFATATLLALAPLVATGGGAEFSGRVIVDAKTGSSGSGAKAASNTHHPQRANSFYAYKPFTHQHVPEIEQSLRSIGDWTSELVFMTHSLPCVRGIFASCYIEMKSARQTEEFYGIYSNFYRDTFFVRMVEGSPDINWVKTTNFCDIGLAARNRQLVVFSALDNLVKGAAGQAIQNMNLMFGFDETTGLLLTGSNP